MCFCSRTASDVLPKPLTCKQDLLQSSRRQASCQAPVDLTAPQGSKFSWTLTLLLHVVGVGAPPCCLVLHLHYSLWKNRNVCMETCTLRLLEAGCGTAASVDSMIKQHWQPVLLSVGISRCCDGTTAAGTQPDVSAARCRRRWSVTKPHRSSTATRFQRSTLHSGAPATAEPWVGNGDAQSATEGSTEQGLGTWVWHQPQALAAIGTAAATAKAPWLWTHHCQAS
jgi:hypothetical protein